jgi:hypothetical protein
MLAPLLRLKVPKNLSQVKMWGQRSDRRGLPGPASSDRCWLRRHSMIDRAILDDAGDVDGERH